MAADPFQAPIQGVTPPMSPATPPPPPPGQPPAGVPDDGAVVASTDQPRKGWKGNKKIIATILGVLFLVGGVGAGIVLIGQRQDIREKAQQAVCSTDADCSVGQICSDLTCVTEAQPAVQTAGCPFNSLQARVHRNDEEPWDTSIPEFTCGETFKVGLFINGWGTLTDDASVLGGDARTPKMTISGAGINQVVNQNLTVLTTEASSTRQTITYTGEVLTPNGTVYQEPACNTQITFSCSASSSVPPADDPPEDDPPVGGTSPTTSPTSSPTASPTAVPSSTTVPTAPPDLPESGVGTPALLGISLGGIMLLVSFALAF